MSLSGRGVENKKRTNVVVALPPVVKKSSKSRSFHFRYLELCRAKNLTPVPEIRSNSSTTSVLDLLGDKLGVTEWQLINEALYHDLVLQTLIIRMRRTNGNNCVLPIDTENRARLFRQKPVIYTRFIFNSLVEAISNCVKLNKNLTVLKLEGLPLHNGYIETIAKSLASNDCLKELSFQKSYIGDKGCEAVCGTVKYLNHVEIFNVSDCNISSKGAEHVADMIKMQKITRFSEGWEKSLRYRSVDVDSIAGLRVISLANNPDVGDNGLRPIAEVLKEDAWVKSIDVENCGLTDCGANIILECLSLNNALTEFNVRQNAGISKYLLRQIRDHFGKEDEEVMNEPKYDLSCVNGLQSLNKSQKYSISQLLTHTKSLEEQLSLERTLRKKAEKLNEKLNQHLMSMDHGHIQSLSSATPTENVLDNSAAVHKGYVLVKNEYLQSFSKTAFKNGDPLPQQSGQLLVNSTVTSSDSTPRSTNSTLRKQQQMEMLQAEQSAAEFPEESDSQAYQAMAENPMLRQQLQVRKVRSEMKYVEAMTKDNAKKRESKSDHEFANERDFKLNPNVQFETDIGDSCLVTEQRYHEQGGAEYYEMQGQKLMYNMPLEAGGDSMRKDNRKHIAKIMKPYNDMGNKQMALHIAELELKINKSSKKRHKSTLYSNEAREVTMNDHMQVTSFMENMEDSPGESPENGSDSDSANTDSTRCPQSDSNNSVRPMKVFMRRTTHCDDGQSELCDGQNGTNQILSPRSVYLEMQQQQQQKKNEINH